MLKNVRTFYLVRIVNTVLLSKRKVIISEDAETGKVGSLSAVVESYPTVKSRMPMTL